MVSACGALDLPGLHGVIGLTYIDGADLCGGCRDRCAVAVHYDYPAGPLGIRVARHRGPVGNAYRAVRSPHHDQLRRRIQYGAVALRIKGRTLNRLGGVGGAYADVAVGREGTCVAPVGGVRHDEAPGGCLGHGDRIRIIGAVGTVHVQRTAVHLYVDAVRNKDGLEGHGCNGHVEHGAVECYVQIAVGYLYGYVGPGKGRSLQIRLVCKRGVIDLRPVVGAGVYDGDQDAYYEDGRDGNDRYCRDNRICLIHVTT